VRLIIIALLVTGSIAISSRALAADPAPLVLEVTIPLGNVEGRIDHLAVNLGQQRLYVAELGNDSVDEIDLATKKVIGRISGLNEPQGLSFMPEQKLLAVASGGDGKVSFFYAADLSPAGSVALGDDADNLHADTAGRRLVAGYGEGGLAVIDPENRTLLADIRLPAHPEGFQLSHTGTRAFVNLPDSRQIAVADLDAGRASELWPAPWASGNFPMAIDGMDKVLAVGFRSPPMLALINLESGVLITRIKSCGDADDLFFDDGRQRIYESCGEGVVDAYDYTDGRLARLARLPTSPGTRTSLFVPELDRLYVAERADWFGSGAKILVYRPTP
jgi:sugar lactone lactonase YvrE